MQKYKLSIILSVMTLSVFALLVMTSSVSAQSTPWQINGNNVYYTDGKVGIGTRAPTEELDIVGDIKVRGPANQAGEGGSIHFTTFGRNNSGPKIKSSLVNADGENSQADLILSSYYGRDMDEITLKNGRVGIGTDNPEAILGIKLEADSGWTSTKRVLNIVSPNEDYQLNLGTHIISPGNVGYTFMADKLGTEREGLTIDSYGNVGVGTMSPVAKLDIKMASNSGWSGTRKALNIVSPNEDYQLNLGTHIISPGNVGYTFKASKLGVEKNAITVNSYGNVGVNKTNPSHTFAVDGSVCLGNC